MGRVYRALDTRVSRHVAVKVLFGAVAADDKARARFKQEAEAAGRLAHSNLVSVSDYDESGGHVFLVMDFVEGENLADVIYREAPLPPARAVALARQLAAGLQHAHERGLIHRDFKPANIILVREGNEERPRILDFGLAILADTESHRLTTNGLVLGTPAFMSPEQACGEPIDHRSDLFALGLIMYEMLAGKHPFDGTAASIARQNLAADPPPLRKRAPTVDVPAALEAIVFRLLAKQPAERFQSAAELIDALDQLFAAPAARSGSASPSVPGAAPRHRRWPWMTAAALLGVSLAGAVWWRTSAPGRLAADELASARDTALPSPVTVAGEAPAAAAAPAAGVTPAVASGVAPEAQSGAASSVTPAVTSGVAPEAQSSAASGAASETPAPAATGERAATRGNRPASRQKAGRRAESAAAAADAEISVEALRARYYAVGAQVDRLERERGSGAARPLRDRYLAIPYLDAVRVEALRRDAYRELADIGRDARRALGR
jgi:hypothetical protein